MSITGPLVLQPRLDPKPWGGRGLARFGFDLPADAPIGEALLTAAEAVVARGPHAGERLGDLVAADPVGTIGDRGLALTGGRPLFPLLIKLIDAEQDLSIQVHPDDARAPAGSLGKSEAWHVLHARPGAVLYVGLAESASVEQFAALARQGERTSLLLRRVPATPGTTVYLPAGTLHALGAGVTIYEIQQPSAVTYRLDDWGRRDAHGRPREMHLDAGLAVLDPASRPNPLTPSPVDGDPRRHRLVTTPFFAAERIELPSGDGIALDGGDGPQAVTCLAGEARVTTAEASESLAAGESAVFFADAGQIGLLANSAVALLRGRMPDTNGPPHDASRSMA